MKKILTNIMSTTGITLVILAAVALLYGGECLFVSTVFQILAANAAVHFGLILTNKYENKYPILEALLNITYTTAVILIFGFIFDWYSSTPIGILIIMVLLVYVIGYFISVLGTKEDMEEINRLLRERKDSFKSKG